METQKEKKTFKTPNVYVILFFVLVFTAILTWIIPGGQYKLNDAGQAIGGTYSKIQSNPQGIWEIIMAPIIGMVGDDAFTGAISISLDVMVFGSFLEMVNRTGALDIGLKNIAKKYENNYKILITILVFAMMSLGTIYGAYEEGFVYLMMFLSVILSLGLDTIVVLMIVIFGTAAGCGASIINPFSTGIAAGIAGITPGEGIGQRIVAFVVLGLVISYLISSYAGKILKNPEKSTQFHRRELDLEEFSSQESIEKLNPMQKKVFAVFILTFSLLIIGLIPWTTLSENFTFFEDSVTWITSIPILGTILGKTFVPFGQWYFNEMTALMIIMTFVVGFIAKYDIDKSINIFIKGASDLVSTALIVPMARGIQVLMTNGNITSTILNFGEKTLANLPPIPFVLICLVFYFALASLMPSSSGLAAATMSIMAPLAVFAGLHETDMIMIYNFALGIVKMLMPTSIIVMTCTQVVHVDYMDWIKSTWKMWIVVILTCCILLVANVLIFS
ncbi:YfcC family protein [Vagococcus elongatus]|uniref:C4-dicarboxylate ABC transporter n=1 Tax=Vagococcus elongatus TaxID=180344 RepID=A0A430AHT1_9ENTE|nr:YfcC family protein [Vagococcus elongatus]RSU07630.1 C4-dicarboxylate ABC transporter [Vagococcus elongatus]